MKGDPLTAPGRFNPLDRSHPLVGRDCMICHRPFRPGDHVALLDSGIPSEGLTVEADPAHERCVDWAGVLERMGGQE
jgi:hypothetical protein